MRVIAGSARSLRLKTLDGMDTRPTTDRIKETLFNMIGPSMFDCVFLDLFAGSGGIGIEALSRGAREAVFVENNRIQVLSMKIPRSLWKRQKKLIFRIYRIWDLKLSEKKRIKRISTCLSRRRGKRKYVKSNLSGQF